LNPQGIGLRDNLVYNKDMKFRMPTNLRPFHLKNPMVGLSVSKK